MAPMNPRNAKNPKIISKLIYNFKESFSTFLLVVEGFTMRRSKY